MCSDFQLLTTKDAAKYIGYNAEVIRKMCRTGRFPSNVAFVIPGSRFWRFDKEKLAEWARGTNEPSPEAE